MIMQSSHTLASVKHSVSVRPIIVALSSLPPENWRSCELSFQARISTKKFSPQVKHLV